jgi:hypothetical protein
MKKFVLNLEELAVESFETQAPWKERGTVLGAESEIDTCYRSLDIVSECTCAVSVCSICWFGPNSNSECNPSECITCPGGWCETWEHGGTCGYSGPGCPP